jgi:hypothetical protein
MATKKTVSTDAEMKSDISYEVNSNHDVQHGTSKPATGFQYWVRHLAVETGGIERVTDQDRMKHTSKVWNACTFW